MPSEPEYKTTYHDMDREIMMEMCRRAWPTSETPCGNGSTRNETRYIQSYLPKILKKYGVRRLADAGAGDLYWRNKINLPCEVTSYDVIPRHPDVIELDLTQDVMAPADMILCRHVLNHLGIELVKAAIENFRKCSPLLLMTNADNQRDYWKWCQYSIGEPIESWKDSGKWRLELYEI